ncbi:hypothetical protein RFI_16630, partial [Reticulomyxa filosa]
MNQIPGHFQDLSAFPIPLSESQCVLYKHEILICGGFRERDCYSYHTIKNEYKHICSYPSDVMLRGHCLVKLVNNSKGSDCITLLSFGRSLYAESHTLMMSYVSVWDNDSKMNKSKDNNVWVPFTDNNDCLISIGRDEDDYEGVRAVVGGSNNHLLFITYEPENIDVFDLNTFQYIKRGTLPAGYSVFKHCFVLKPKDGLEMMNTIKHGNKNEKKNKNEMLLFCKKTGLSIEYDEDNNTFQFHKLPICDDISPFYRYSYVYVSGVILLFGGWNGSFLSKVVSKSVHKYSIRENKWTTFENSLPIPLSDSVAILNQDGTYLHIIGGKKNCLTSVPTHMKTKVSKWLNEKNDKTDQIIKEEKHDLQNKIDKDAI